MKVGFTKGHNPAHVRLHHRLLAMQYPDACLLLGLFVDIVPMSHSWRDFPPVLRVQQMQVPRQYRFQEEKSPMQTVFLEDIAVDNFVASSF
jgi:hypothetical protein